MELDFLISRPLEMDWIGCVEEGRAYYRKNMRNALLVWGKLIKFLSAKKRFQVKGLVLTFPDTETFLQFYTEVGIGYFLEKLKKNALYRIKKACPELKDKNLKFYYLAFVEFTERGVPHLHIVIATNFKFFIEDIGLKQYFQAEFSYGYIYIQNLTKNFNPNYILKPKQKEPYFIGALLRILKYNKNYKKPHLVYVSSSLKKDFPTHFQKLKSIKSFHILKNAALYCQSFSKPNKHTYIFHFPNNIEIKLQNCFTLHHDHYSNKTHASYKYSIVSIYQTPLPNHQPPPHKIHKFITRSAKDLSSLLQTLISSIFQHLNQPQSSLKQLNIFLKSLQSIYSTPKLPPTFNNTPLHFHHTFSSILPHTPITPKSLPPASIYHKRE